MGKNEVLGFGIVDVDETKEQLVPIVITGTIATVISFPDQFQGVARGVLIDNRDGVNALLFRVNSRATPQKTIPSGGNFVIADQKVVLLDISGSTNWEVTASIKSMDDMPRIQAQSL